MWCEGEILKIELLLFQTCLPKELLDIVITYAIDLRDPFEYREHCIGHLIHKLVRRCYFNTLHFIFKQYPQSRKWIQADIRYIFQAACFSGRLDIMRWLARSFKLKSPYHQTASNEYTLLDRVADEKGVDSLIKLIICFGCPSREICLRIAKRMRRRHQLIKFSILILLHYFGWMSHMMLTYYTRRN